MAVHGSLKKLGTPLDLLSPWSLQPHSIVLLKKYLYFLFFAWARMLRARERWSSSIYGWFTIVLHVLRLQTATHNADNTKAGGTLVDKIWLTVGTIQELTISKQIKEQETIFITNSQEDRYRPNNPSFYFPLFPDSDVRKYPLSIYYLLALLTLKNYAAFPPRIPNVYIYEYFTFHFPSSCFWLAPRGPYTNKSVGQCLANFHSLAGCQQPALPNHRWLSKNTE